LFSATQAASVSALVGGVNPGKLVGGGNVGGALNSALANAFNQSVTIGINGTGQFKWGNVLVAASARFVAGAVSSNLMSDNPGAAAMYNGMVSGGYGIAFGSGAAIAH
jgi:hypothetical protein